VPDPQTTAYIASLPEVDTARLPRGAIFLANDRLYQVVETGSSGYHKARECRKNEDTDVALIPGSFLSRTLPLIRRGRLLPVYRTRLELTQDDRPPCFVFPTETLALDAAYLDVTLIQSSGAYVRNEGSDPAFSVTDGVHVFRLYYYRQSVRGRLSDLSGLQARPLQFTPRPHTEGPGYWRLLSSWAETSSAADAAQRTMTIPRPSFDGEDTVPTPVPPPDLPR
jgi:hypothetical protein